MNLKLLIDGIVRQTTVLIAQLSTASGARSPLSHVTDEVFVSLAREIEAQGVRKQVVADMFGMAMRSYQKKMARLTESASQRERSLWEAVFDFVAEHSPTRARILERFAYDGEREVVAVLNDLVRSGIVFSTGSGDKTVFGATSSEVRRSVQHEHDQESLQNWIWLMVFRGEARHEGEVCDALRMDAELVHAAIEELVNSGRLRRNHGTLHASNVVVPLGTEQGWETAVLDHFRTVAVAIAQKVRGGFTPSKLDDRTGGSTFTFTIDENSPHGQVVLGLLAETRTRVQALWDEVAAHNQQHPPDPQTSLRITFYLGQLTQPSPDTEVDASPSRIQREA